MAVSGDSRRTLATNSATAFAEWTVPVGLFGLQKNTSPAQRAAWAILSRSRRPSLSTGTRRTPTPSCLATTSGCSKDGDAVTRWRDDEVQRRTAVESSSQDPEPRATFSGRTPCRRAMVSRRSATEGRALVGYRPASGKARTNASTAAGPGPSGFSLLLILISAGSPDTAASPGGDPARAASRPRAAIRAAGSGAPPRGPTRFRNERRESDMTP